MISAPTNKQEPAVAGSGNPIVLLGRYKPGALDGEIAAFVGQADGLHSLGVNLEVWCFSRFIKEPKNFKTRTGAEIWELPLYRYKIFSVCAIPAVTRRWIQQRLPHVQMFHFHGVFSPIHNLVAGFGKPYATTPHGGWNINVFEGRNRLIKKVWVGMSEKRFWSGARFVQATSDGEEKQLRRLPGLRQVEKIPNGVEMPPLESVSKQRDVWAYIGRLDVDLKGIDRMVRAYALCRKKGVSLPKLVIAGPDHRGGRQFLIDLIAANGLEKDIELPGPVQGKEKETLFKRASLFIHTSRSEAFPLAILEALAWGVPCLVTPGTNFCEVIKEAGAGYPTGESDEEIAAVMAAVDSKESLPMGLRGREYVENRYTWRHVAERLLKSYQHLCGAAAISK